MQLLAARLVEKRNRLFSPLVHCLCDTTIQGCCNSSWGVTLAGFRFTHHKSPVKIFGDPTLDKITNYTRLFRLKQRTLLWRFEIFHMPGLSNQAADAASRHPLSCNFIVTVSPLEHDSPDVVEQAVVAAIQRETSENVCLQ